MDRYYYQEQMRRFRRRAGWTQTEAAEKTGTRYGTYRAWETGVSSPPLDKALELCDAFHCTPNQLCGFDEDWRGGVDSQPSITEEEKWLLACWHRLTEERKSQVMAHMMDAAFCSENDGGTGHVGEEDA